MKRIHFTLILFVLLFASNQIYAQRIEWIRARNLNDWERILRMAGNTEMGIFVQVCSEWSQICLNMNNFVLRDRQLVTELNRRFIPVQIDGDSDFGQLWIRHYSLPGYPVHLFMNSAENVLIRLNGAQDRETIRESTRRATTLLTLYPQLQSAYIAGQLSARGYSELMRIEIDNNGVDATRPIFRDYIAKFGSELLQDSVALGWISVFGLDVQDNLFGEIVNRLSTLTLQPSFNLREFLDASLNVSLQRAVRDSSEAQLGLILDQLIPLKATADSVAANRLRIQTRKLFYFDTNNPEKFFQALTEEFADSSAESRRSGFNETASELMDSRSGEQWAAVAVRIMQEVIAIRDDMNARIGLAGALTMAREFDQAVQQLNVARQLTNDSLFRAEIDNMIQRVRRMQLGNQQ